MEQFRTLKELATALGIGPTHLSRLIAGGCDPSVGLCRRLEEATGIFAAIWAFGTTAQKRAAIKDYLRAANGKKGGQL